MHFDQLESQVLALPTKPRASLVRRLLETLPATRQDVADSQVLTWDQELEDKKVQALSHKQFVRNIEKSRRR